jgi:hypothetical protein
VVEREARDQLAGDARPAMPRARARRKGHEEQELEARGQIHSGGQSLRIVARIADQMRREGRA